MCLAEALLRIPEPLYTRTAVDLRATGEKIFDYVDPRKRDYQIEMEQLATAHLQRMGAWLAPEFASVPVAAQSFPVTASVVIPVRNRANTIADAVRSALAQQANFPFNVIVVDNHSSDGTTQTLQQLAAEDSRLIHLQPQRTDLGIGGCWNEAIFSEHCGRYAVQLDSDDIYSNEQTLARIVAELLARSDEAAVVLTRAEAAQVRAAVEANPGADVRGTTVVWRPAPPRPERVVLLTAGTADLPVADECAATLVAHGLPPVRVTDVGVAGIHRLLDRTDELTDADAVIVVAGMEGALASVVGGLTGAPVVAVPTSVGYGAGLEGVTALLGMLASCAAGITVVGIDNGYGGAFAVARMFVSPQGVRRANASAADVRQGSS